VPAARALVFTVMFHFSLAYLANSASAGSVRVFATGVTRTSSSSICCAAAGAAAQSAVRTTASGFTIRIMAFPLSADYKSTLLEFPMRTVLPLDPGATQGEKVSRDEAPGRPHLRIATEEAWATREQVDLYRRLLATRSSDDPGFESMWGHFSGGASERVTRILERLLDTGEGRIHDMDAAGIDKQLLLLTSPGVQVFDAATAVAVAASSNDQAAEVVRRHPDRFAALAAIAPQDPQAGAGELERSVKRLG